MPVITASGESSRGTPTRTPEGRTVAECATASDSDGLINDFANFVLCARITELVYVTPVKFTLILYVLVLLKSPGEVF